MNMIDKHICYDGIRSNHTICLCKICGKGIYCNNCIKISKYNNNIEILCNRCYWFTNLKWKRSFLYIQPNRSHMGKRIA